MFFESFDLIPHVLHDHEVLVHHRVQERVQEVLGAGVAELPPLRIRSRTAAMMSDVLPSWKVRRKFLPRTMLTCSPRIQRLSSR
jgi:hypothetical protein